MFSGKGTRLVFYFFLIAVVSLILQFTEFTSFFFLTGPVNDNIFFSPLSIISLVLLADVVILALLRTSNYHKPASNIKSIILTGFLYLLVLFSALFVIYFIKILYINSGIDFNIEALFNIGVIELFWFTVFINILILYFLFSLLLFKWINALNLPFKIRSILSVGLIIITTVFIFFYSDIEVFTILLSFLIYFFLMDYFSEQKKINSSWLFSWLIVISGFTTLIIYHVYSIHQDAYRNRQIQNLIFERNDSIEKKFDELEQGITFETESGKYYVDTLYLDSIKLLNLLNSGFIKTEPNIYFNPITGEYFKLKSNANEKNLYNLIYLYNVGGSGYEKLRSRDAKYIVLNRDNILFNNTGIESIKIPEKIVKNKMRRYEFKGNMYFYYENKDGIEVILVEKIPGVLRPLSLFSLVFILTGIFWFFIAIFNTLFRFLPSIIDLNFSNINSLKAKIQFSIIGILIVSFFVLGIITFHYFYNYNIQNKKHEAKQILSLANAGLVDNSSRVDFRKINNKLLDLKRNSGIELYAFDENGVLVKDPRRNYSDWYNLPEINALKDKLSKNKNSLGRIFFKNENYLLAFSPLIHVNKVKGYLGNVSAIDNSSIMAASDILSNFLNIYVLLFLLSGAIAITLANSISKPIEILGAKMEYLSLNQNNELIDWKKQDELGKLIEIYNLTVKKLKESAKIITKIERDAAWRDMAKQVAHEIKNPLTPLKLNIQYLQSYVNRNPDSASEMVNQIAPSLIEQINNLDKIATEFSDFAKMPNARNEKVNLNEIAKVVHDFFRKRDDLDFQLIVPINDLIVFADKNHIVSILNNIIKNAIQAIPNDRSGKIIMELYRDNGNSIIKISDNGSGISDDMKDKVFSPNFTTKSSGTGLGLAISSSMIQSFNGKIYFETELNVGTTFFIEIPLMRNTQNIDGTQRVSLDD